MACRAARAPWLGSCRCRAGHPAHHGYAHADGVRGGLRTRARQLPKVCGAALRTMAVLPPMACGTACAPRLGICRWRAGHPANQGSASADGEPGILHDGPAGGDGVLGGLRTKARRVATACGAACAQSLGICRWRAGQPAHQGQASADGVRDRLRTKATLVPRHPRATRPPRCRCCSRHPHEPCTSAVHLPMVSGAGRAPWLGSCRCRAGHPAHHGYAHADGVRGGLRTRARQLPKVCGAALRTMAVLPPMACGTACAPRLGICRWRAGHPANQGSASADGEPGILHDGPAGGDGVLGGLRTKARRVATACGAACAQSLGICRWRAGQPAHQGQASADGVRDRLRTKATLVPRHPRATRPPRCRCCSRHPHEPRRAVHQRCSSADGVRGRPRTMAREMPMPCRASRAPWLRTCRWRAGHPAHHGSAAADAVPGSLRTSAPQLPMVCGAACGPCPCCCRWRAGQPAHEGSASAADGVRDSLRTKARRLPMACGAPREPRLDIRRS